jgi:IS5 family transposase
MVAALYDRQAVRRFVGADLSRERALDAPTLLKFRRSLEGKKKAHRNDPRIDQGAPGCQGDASA